jgi:hypothetical protein
MPRYRGPDEPVDVLVILDQLLDVDSWLRKS